MDDEKRGVSFSYEDKRRLETLRSLMMKHAGFIGDDSIGLGSACSIAIDLVGFFTHGERPVREETWKEWLTKRILRCPRSNRVSIVMKDGRHFRVGKDKQLWRLDGPDPDAPSPAPNVDFEKLDGKEKP